MKALLWILGATLAVTIVITSVPAAAHHASGPFYDSEKRVEAVGTVTKFVFRNPRQSASAVTGPSGSCVSETGIRSSRA